MSTTLTVLNLRLPEKWCLLGPSSTKDVTTVVFKRYVYVHRGFSLYLPQNVSVDLAIVLPLTDFFILLRIYSVHRRLHLCWQRL